ncbi:hypothetical protein BZG02_15675 [Labilibaculum filiforme]|uniref:histidine kinase n=1 Tax=Labilibaculum filiforme TaxID=1940526 RepID=A0A2N3HTL9_9BACT|nr:two-component regulator propeller domain-containing protein [Labilibaculum filiforme]PKQ61396.1 hypothetical protein BZG02_15675 [Labilibaculum filiforme]
MSKYLQIVVIVLFWGINVFATPEQSKLEPLQQITISEGLSHNGVTSVLEDSKGYLWVGTYDGLNRYNGYEVKSIRNTIDEKLMVSNRVRALLEDKNGNIWIGSDKGVSIYDYSTEKITDIYSNSFTIKGENGPIVRKMIKSENGDIVCITDKEGVLIFQDDYTFKSKHLPSKNITTEDVLFHDGLQLNEAFFLFSTSVGLLQFNLESKNFKHILRDEILFSTAILKIEENELLLSKQEGLAIIKINDSGSELNFQLSPTYLKEHKFVSFSVDQLNNLWLGTVNRGIIHIQDLEKFKNRKKNKVSVFKANTTFLRVSCVVSNTSSGCWIGTFEKGLYRFPLNENPFHFYASEMNSKYGIATNGILSITALDKERVYIVSNSGGVALFNTNTRNFEALPFNLVNDLAPRVGLLSKDSKANIWISSGNVEDEVLLIPSGSKKVISIGGNRSFKLKDIRAIEEDKYGNFWIGGANNVFKIKLNEQHEIIDIQSLIANPYFDDNKFSLTRVIYVDTEHDFIWIGTDTNGLYRVDTKGNISLEKANISQYSNNSALESSLSSNFVSSIFRIPNGDLWIGTEQGGVYKVEDSNKAPSFIRFSEKEGLSNNVVKNICYDGDENLWITTNIGLNKFNLKTERISRYRKEDGLPFEAFDYASCVLKNGQVVLSSQEGFCYFNPDLLISNKKMPWVELGSFSVNNKLIEPKDTINGRVILNKRIGEESEIELKYDENVFTIQLTALHFENPENHLIKYRLFPLNSDWIKVPSEKCYIDFNGVQPGEYWFEYSGSNSFDQWTKVKRLKITIKPPFWKSNLAIVFYIVFVLAFIIVIMRIIIRMKDLKHSLEIELIEKERSEEITNAKFRFFSNISHEFKTPLTLISGPIEFLMRRFQHDPELKDRLDLVNRQSHKMSQLVDQVHDFQKADKNLLQTHYSTFRFDLFIKDMILEYAYLAKNSSKQLELIGELPPVVINADKDKLEKILNNLLSNAFKFTKVNDFIRINYWVEKDNNLVVTVADSGKGIHPKDIAHVFERFYQSQQKNNEYIGGSGIGLAFSKKLVEMHYGTIAVESEYKHGTTFTFKLPVVTEAEEEVVSRSLEGIIAFEKNFNNNESISNKESQNYQINEKLVDSVIYLVEDNADMRLFIERELSKIFKVKSFENGLECLNAMELEWPDIIISDVLMPELNGLDLTKQIKSDVKTSHIPIILLTACTTVEDQIEGLKNGADAYIVKPFNMTYLITTAETILLNRKMLRERFQIDFRVGVEKKSLSAGDSIFLEKLYGLITDNLSNQELDLDLFASELCLNRTLFYQKVKQLTDNTPFELLKMYRLKKAAELLVNTDMQVSEISDLTGFKSRTHFSKLFKDKYDVTPGKYAMEQKMKSK